MNISERTEIAIYKGETEYPESVPFHPGRIYPEYPFKDYISKRNNFTYEAVRNSLYHLGLDKKNFGSPSWNPLGDLIFPGDHVVLKPNLISESRSMKPDEWMQIITHPSIIRAILDYVYVALKGKGRITIADGPQTDSDFEAIQKKTGLNQIIKFFKQRSMDISLIDLRKERWLQKGNIITERIPLSGDPIGYSVIQLNHESEFTEYRLNGKFYGADYDITETAKYHGENFHKYVLSRSILDADVLINLPKMKTHKKTGVTLSLKNIVGINGLRNCLPHFSIGTPSEGGDEFPNSHVSQKMQSRLILSFKKAMTLFKPHKGHFGNLAIKIGRYFFGDTKKVVRSGNWYGNDTAWRMVLDLNKSLFYYSGDGELRVKPLRQICLVDGIIAGEGDGPLDVDAKPVGLIIAGFNPVVVDTICANLMGFDYHKIPVIAKAWRIKELPLIQRSPQSIICNSNVDEWKGTLNDIDESECLKFRPPIGWKGHIERQEFIEPQVSNNK